MPDNTTAEVASSTNVRDVAKLYYGFDECADAARVIEPEDVPLRARHFALADALDSLREAVQPVRGIVTAADTWPKAGTVIDGRVLYYEVDAPSLQQLLSAISRLISESVEGGNG